MKGQSGIWWMLSSQNPINCAPDSVSESQEKKTFDIFHC